VYKLYLYAVFSCDFTWAGIYVILLIWKYFMVETMAAAKKQRIDEQISLVVHGFVQVWNDFEDALAKELAAKNSHGKDSRLNATCETVFRVGNSLTGRTMSMGELSTALSVPLSTATRVVDLLVEEGYIQRSNDPDDRRIVRVSFTERGQELYKLMDGYITARVRKITGYLKEDELETLLARDKGG
jgi:DNA-binding MarR family transcriptional regulator